MTKVRTPNSVHDVLIEVYALLGVSNAAEVVGKSEPHIRAWSDPDSDRHPSVLQCAQLDAACVASGGKPLLAIWLAREADKALQGALPAREAEELPDSVLDVATQFGVLAQTVRDALKDKQITTTERNQILQGVKKMRAELDELEYAANYTQAYKPTA